MNNVENEIYTGQLEYDKNFWDVMRGNDFCYDGITKGRSIDTGTYAMPATASNKYMEAIGKESLFRQIATAFNAYHSDYRILAKDCNDLAQFVPEGGSIPIYDGLNDFTTYTVETWKLASFVKLDEDFVHDATFDIEKYLVSRLAKNFGKAETNAFINGNGEQMPTGILHESKGANVAFTTDTVTYDNIIKLFFSVKPEYRSNAMWLMNDETAMALRTMKDTAGNYLWRDGDDTILGKKVIISEFMPNAESGKKPIAFGDFSYYWVISRSPVSVRTLKEKFVVYDQIGYLAFEFLDGKLIRPEAIKVIQMS
ncbi:MAG: phage major capsid protein [Candidatus Metalachnospira sp.]|nr:phage major capsid protein [Candidatus Metalachnospira sp.]